MKKQIIISFTIIFLLFGFGSSIIVQNLINSTESLRNLINLHEIEDIRQNLNLRAQKVQTYVHLTNDDFFANIDEINTNIDLLKGSIKGCFDCHHKEIVKRDLLYTEKLISDFQKNLLLLSIPRPFSSSEWQKTIHQQSIILSDDILSSVQDMVHNASVTLQRKTDEAMKGIDKTYGFLISTFLITLGLSVVIATYVIHRLTKPVADLSIATKKISAGELGYTTPTSSISEFTELIERFNEMSQALAIKEQENADLCRNLENKLDELSKTQDKLLTAEKLASLGKLAGGISHDFNNILCGIIGYLSLLKMSWKGSSDDFKVIESIEKAAQHASKLVNQLQTFASPKNWDEINIQINNIIEPAIKSVQNELKKSVKVNLQLEEDLAEIKGDPDRINELIKNICKNSIQAMQDDGVLGITTETICLSGEEGQRFNLLPGRYIKIQISDNGKGISEQILGKVFDPYFSTQDLGSEKGVGLGMAIAFSIVSRHHGQISIDSKEGSETNVYIYLPALAEN